MPIAMDKDDYMALPSRLPDCDASVSLLAGLRIVTTWEQAACYWKHEQTQCEHLLAENAHVEPALH